MVRLVFRPYTQVRRSICTLESLRTSTRVSPGFALLRHSSPSFGSQHVCSHSNLSLGGSWSVDSAAFDGFLPQRTRSAFTLIPRWGIQPRALAHMLDSLVRVSRRDDKKHFVRVFCTRNGTPTPHGNRTSFSLPKKPNLQIATRLSRMRKKQNNHLPTLLPIGSISAISGTF